MLFQPVQAPMSASIAVSLATSLDNSQLEKKPELVESTQKAIHFAKKWIEENEKNPIIQSLKDGDAVKLSRREIHVLHSKGQLSYSLNKLFKDEGFDRSVVIIRRAPNQYAFAVQRHKHEFDLHSKRDVSQLEKKGISKIFNNEGAINNIFNLDTESEMQLLHRKTKPKVNNDEAHHRMIKQKKTENALMSAPLVMNRFAQGSEISHQHFSHGLKHFKGSIYKKMAADGKKYFNYDAASLTLESPIEAKGAKGFKTNR